MSMYFVSALSVRSAQHPRASAQSGEPPVGPGTAGTDAAPAKPGTPVRQSAAESAVVRKLVCLVADVNHLCLPAFLNKI